MNSQVKRFSHRKNTTKLKKEKRKQIEIQMAGHATTLKYGQSSTHRCFLGV
jgi:hypothetical protein